VRCYYHQDHEAVGACKSCGKGLCPLCLVDLGKGMACKGRCEANVRGLILATDVNVGMAAKIPRQMRANRLMYSGLAWFLIVCGALPVALGVVSGHPTEPYVIGGGFFLVFGLAILLLTSRMPRFDERDPIEQQPRAE
jgi:hypothetical protein